MRKIIGVATLLIAVTAGAARAQENIKVGLITPLTGNSARVGEFARSTKRSRSAVGNS